MGDEAPLEESDAQRELRYRAVRDREPLKRLENGLTIVRCRKHEPISLENLTRDQIAVRTGKRWVSKFAAGWGLSRYVDWIEATVKEVAWTLETGPIYHEVVFLEPVGISNGVAVHTITMRSDGRYLHAYPDQDSDE
jgi:hypothetical protein